MDATEKKQEVNGVNIVLSHDRSFSSPESDGALGLSGLLTVIGLWHTFKKAGQPCWTALVRCNTCMAVQNLMGKWVDGADVLSRLGVWPQHIQA